MYLEIENTGQFLALIAERGNKLKNVAFQCIDFGDVDQEARNVAFENCVFLGCKMSMELTHRLIINNAVFPRLNVPFNCYPNSLYDYKSLYRGYRLGCPESYCETYDKKVYDTFVRNGKESNDVVVTLARSLHDQSISDAQYDLLSQYDEHKVIGIMGGHGMLRTDEDYKSLAFISKRLTESGCLMVSGGGPGAMEATHFGAWYAGYSDDDMLAALEIMKQAPAFTDRFWLDVSLQILSKSKEPLYESLGIPTWLYGHEPPTPFATKIAKYFANSIREDGLLTIAKGGIIYAPGSAGTVQEVFQDATQNHYLSFGYASPMAFFNKKYWTEKMPIYPMLEKLQEQGCYKNLILSLNDSVDEVINALNI